MGNYLLSVAGLSAAGSLFMRGDSSEPLTWAWAALAVLALVVAGREFARGVFAEPQRAFAERPGAERTGRA